MPFVERAQIRHFRAYDGQIQEVTLARSLPAWHVLKMTLDASMRPLERIYHSGEEFEVSAAGFQAWRRSDSFVRSLRLYSHYPAHSLQSDEARALLHHLIVMQKPERVLEIGTMYAGTTEVLARAVLEAGRGHVDTIDPYGAARCPPLIAGLPPELRERITFFPVSSAIHFDQAIAQDRRYDFVLIDGSHELEFVTFDLDCMPRVLRPGGLVVLDNIEQVGPRTATMRFLERHPDWIDVADVVRLIDPNEPLKTPEPSFPDTKLYVLRAPGHYTVATVPVSFGNRAVDSKVLSGVDFVLSAPAKGTVHIRTYVRTFGIIPSEELSQTQKTVLDEPAGPLSIPLTQPLRSHIADNDGLDRRIEIILAFVGEGPLTLAAPPTPYPARHL